MCREDVLCRTKVFYLPTPGEGNPVTPFALKGDELVPHVCRVVPGAEFPDALFLGIWRNTRTDRLRYQGPAKKLDNALRNPEPSNRVDGVQVFELVEVKWCEPDWQTFKLDSPPPTAP